MLPHVRNKVADEIGVGVNGFAAARYNRPQTQPFNAASWVGQSNHHQPLRIRFAHDNIILYKGFRVKRKFNFRLRLDLGQRPLP